MSLVAAFALAKQNKSDSAIRYLKQVRDIDRQSVGDRVLYIRCQAQLALSRGDIGQYQHYYERADYLSDSVSTSEVQRQLREVEANMTTRH